MIAIEVFFELAWLQLDTVCEAALSESKLISNVSKKLRSFLLSLVVGVMFFILIVYNETWDGVLIRFLKENGMD